MIEKVKSVLRKGRTFTAEQYYRWLQGMQLLTITNFVLLVVTASDKLKVLTGIQETETVVIIFVPLGMFCVWLAGFVLESRIGLTQEVNLQNYKRNPGLTNVTKILERIEKKLDERW